MIAHETAARVQVSLRRVIYEKIASLGPGAVGRQRSGALTLSLIDGVEQLETYFGQFLPQFLISLLSPVLIFAAIAFIDLPVAAVMLVFALIALVRAGAVAQVRRGALARSPEGLCDLRRRVPRFDPGPRDAEGVQPEQGARRPPGPRGQEPVRAHHVGAGDQRAGARHHRQRDRLRRGRRARARRLPGRGRRDGAVGAAHHPDAGDRDLPPDARAAHGAAPGHGRHVGGARPLPDSRQPAADRRRTGRALGAAARAEPRVRRRALPLSRHLPPGA